MLLSSLGERLNFDEFPYHVLKTLFQDLCSTGKKVFVKSSEHMSHDTRFNLYVSSKYLNVVVWPKMTERIFAKSLGFGKWISNIYNDYSFLLSPH